MRRIHKLVSNSSRKLQSMIGEQKTARKSSRRVMNDLFMEMAPLEERVLMTTEIISSTQMSVDGADPIPLTYDLTDQDSITINSGVSISTNGTSFSLAAPNITFNSNVSVFTGGGEITITGKSLTVGGKISNVNHRKNLIDVGQNVTFNTNNSSGAAGAIELTSPSISIGSNSRIQASGANSTQDGAITISAESENNLTFGVNAWMQLEDLVTGQMFGKDNSATVDVGTGTQIVGGVVSIQATSGNPLKWENWTNLIGSAANAGFALAGHPNLLSLPIAIQYWSPKSEITFGTNSQVVSSSTINVNATSESNAIGKASWFESVKQGFGFAVGLFFTDATANVTVAPGADLQASGNITVASNVTNTIELEAMSIQNRGISPTNPDAINFSAGIGSLTTNSVINVQAGSSVISQTGMVNLGATATDTNKVKVKGKTYRDGLATVSFGTVLTQANVQVIVDGTISAGYSMEDVIEATPLIFNPATTVDFANSQLKFTSNVPYSTGQQLVFDSVDSGTIPGLVPGETYFAIVNAAQPTNLQLATTQANALSGVNIQFGAAYPTLTIGNYNLPITLIDNAYSNSILFSYDSIDELPILSAGDNTTVTYTPAPGRFIGYNDANGNLIGALPAGTYKIKQMQWPAGSMQSELYPLAIQLIDSQNQTVVLNTNSYFTTSDGTNYQVASFDSESSLVDFNFEQPSTDSTSGLTPLPVPNQQVNLANGAALIYMAGLNNPIENLVSGQTYYAEVDPSQSGVIQLATTLAQSQAANPSVQDALPYLKTVNNQACIDSTITGDLENSNGDAISPVLTLESDNSYQLYNSASSGTFQLTINGPEGDLTTGVLAFNATATQVQSALNSLAGIEAKVSGAGTSQNPWVISILFNFEIGNFQNGTELTFINNPNLTDGSAVVFLGVQGKPVPGLVTGQTYYAFNQTNPDFISQFPQYIMSLKASDNASADDIVVDLTQSMTDSNGQTYSIGYQDAEEGLISLYLPQVTAPLAMNGSGLTGGQVFGNQLTAPALVLYSVADSGSFTLSLTDAGGTTQTTAPIAWNATATDVQTALNTLAGINATVVGTGIFTSPWTISGIDPGVSVSDDTSSLLYGGAQTALIKDVAYANTQQVWLGGATGGTFTVTLNYGSNQLITAALPYNASTQQFAQAINALGFQASVTGSGTSTDPWQFMAYYNPIRTGQSLTFNDSWNSNSLGMLNGQTYYAVTSATQYNAGEVMLSLSASASNATASPPVLLDMQGYLQLQDYTSGLMSSPKMGLAAVPVASGVIISAKLKSKDAVTDMAKTGGYPPLKGLFNKSDPYDVSGIGKKEGAITDLYAQLSQLNSNLIDYAYKGGERPVGDKDELQKKIDKHQSELDQFGYKDPKSFLEASLGLAVLSVKNNSQVIIGSQAQIFSAANVKLSSNITEQLHAQADAGVSRTSHSHSKSGNLATALGLAVSILENASQVIVQPNAAINAAGKVNISSYVQYPFAWKATTISQVKQANDLKNSSNGTYPGLNTEQKSWAGIGITSAILTQALTGSGAGMGNWLFNSSSNSYTIQADHDTHKLLGTAIGGSVNIVDITNNNLAQICDGAQINQGAKFTTASSQGVSLTAVTTMDQVSAAGQMKFLLNAAGVVTMHPLDVSKSSNVIGGSVNVVSMDNSTQALIGGTAPENGNSTASPANGPTRINYGQYGLTANAVTDIMYISLSQSGGLASGFGLEASVAVTKINSQNTTAAILSAANAPVILNMANTTGSISIKASDNTTLTPSSGGLLIGKAINLGFSSSEAVLNRNVSAFIGNADPTASVPAAAWPVIQSGGNITIQAIATGKIVPASLAGSVINKGANETGNEVPGNPGSHFGFGVSGDYSEAKVVDSVTAGINGGNLTGVSNQKAIGILAINETRLNLSTGAASLQFERGRDSAVGLAGSASYSDFTSNVWAGVKNADITAFKVGVLAQNNKTIGTFAAGLAGGSVAGVGIEVAGSVAINHETNDTVAEIADTTGRNLGTVDVKAFETDDIWAAAGTVTFVTSFGSAAELDAGKLKTKVGFGFGFAQNLLDSTTHAIISDSDIQQTGGSLSLAAEQASRSFVLSAGTVFEIGKGTGITPYGMVALNQYTNADVQALVENSSITSSSTNSSAGMLIASQLIPIMVTAAGDLGLSIAYKTGVGAEASIGAGVSVTEVSITGNSVASVSNSTITLDQGNLTVNAYTGQSANATDLNNTLTNLNLPPGNYNLFSLAIAGGLTTAIAPEGELAVGVDGVGAGIGSSTSLNTLANITNNSQINLLGNNSSNGSLTVEALENLAVYDDAGGASVSIQTSLDISVGIAVGIGAGVHNSINSAIASVTDSNVTNAGSITVSAESSSNITSVGFGVALDVSISEAAGLSLGISASSATTKIVSDNVISAYITGGLIDSTGSVAVTSTDNSQFQTVAVSGSLSVSFGTLGGVALAAGASVSRIEPSHTISAYIGSIDANMPPQTIVLADGPILVEATNNQHLTAQTIAVASSIAISSSGSIGAATAGAGARITLNNNIKSGLLYGTNLTSRQGSGKTAITVEAIDNGNITSTVGSGALNVSLSLDPFGCIGGSLGISISEITNNDNVVAQVQGANITTEGGDVIVQAVGNNTHFSESVATSVSVSLISVAGAGGNSNIYDNANFTASVDSGSSIITGNAATGYGSLSVLAESSETVMAQMFGGSGSVGSIGVFMSNATRSGSTVANLVTNGTISVGNLTVKATTNQTITSEGMSVTIGVAAGTGETVRLGIDEKVQTNVNGSNNTWNIHGNLSIGAKTTNNATAQASGVSVAIGLGVGFFKVDSLVNPVVSTSISDVKLRVSGTSSMGTLTNSTNHATAQSGSGSLVGGEAARAITDNSPSISLSTTNLTLTSASATFLAQNCGTYSTNADSVYATAVGGSAARAYNTSVPNLTLNLGTGTVITADGSVIVKAENDMVGLGDASNLKTSGIMARVGGGGAIGGFGGTSVSCLTAGSAINLGSNVSISANGRGSKVLIGSSQNWNTNQLTYMHDSSAIGGAGVHSSLTSCLTNNIALGSNVTLLAPSGSVGIGTSIISQTTADSYSYTFAIAGGSRSVADNTQNVCQTVTIGNNSLLKAGGDISVTAGYNPISGAGSLQDTYAIVTAHCTGLISVPGTDATATDNSNMNVTIGSGSQIISDRDVNLGAIPGINNAQWYTFANIDGSKGKTHSGTDGVTQTSNVTINGNVIAGYTHQLDINIPQSGTTASVNGQLVGLANSSSLTNVIPQNGSAFIPFQAAYQTNYNATQLLNGLDETSKLILSKSISTTPVKAITLANLTATGGQVLIHANTSLSGTGTISAFSPNITVTNNSPAYLLLDGVGIPNTLNMGKITVVGSVGLPVGMTLNQQLAGPSINIKQLYNQAVGTGTTSGPAIAVIAPIVNTGGSVAIYNACGALVQDAPINTMTLSISTPNSAYIVNTPKSYLGTGGSISDYWMNSSQNLVQNSSFENPDLGSGSSSYQYNPPSPNWTFTGYSGLSGNGSSFTSGNPNAPAGSQVAFLQMTSVITQTISGLVAGQQYTVSFYAAQRKNYPNQSFNVTLGSTTLVSSLAPNSSNYQNYSYTFTPTSSANQTLTFTGLEPSGQDETVFLDQVIVTPTTTNITPGLNSYVYQYTANLAATTAANDLYLEQSGATNSTAFSNWLYNTGANSGNNGVGVGGVDFVNTNVSFNNPGSLYPSKASNNWGTTEYGTGVIFFGSEIPYLWQNGSATIAGGSSYLTSSLGYLDTLANAQYWSVAASGNPANSDLNVTQGTGPQNDNVNPGRGIYPAVPSNFPTSSSIANPQLATLGNGITAGQLDITALYIDINAPVNLGVNNTGFQANLSAALGTYIQSQLSGNTSCIPIPDIYLGGSNTSLTAYYDVLANQIVLSPVAINAGVVAAIFKGGIISTTNQGKITVTSNPGQNLIDNQTGYPLVIQGIEASESHLAGIVQFNDTLTNLSTAYVYRGNNVVQKYQGPLGPNNGANLSQLQLVSNTSATSATFAPASNLAYQWNQQAFISRNLSFTNTNNSYVLNGTTYGSPAGTVNDSWSWGPLESSGSAPTNYTSATNPFKQGNALLMTDGTTSTANAYWYQTKVDIPTSGQFTINFNYQASGDRAADGMTLAFQNQGVNAIGNTGGALGYQGITGNTVAYQINLYNAGGSHIPGSNFVTTNSTGNYHPTGNVNFTSGDWISVQLVYDAENHTVTENLKDLSTNMIYQNIYDNVNLGSVLGSQAYIGFTGGEGGATSIQVVSDFSMTTPNLTLSGFESWANAAPGGVVAISTTNSNYTEQISAIITQSETATTYFSGNYQDAWNFGPSTQWTWTYPTEILLQIKNQLPACNPIAIDFSGVQSGSLSIVSNSNMSLAGNIQFPGSVNLGTNGGSISQSIGALIASDQLQMTATGGSVGSSDSPIQINIPATSALSAIGDQGVFVNSQGTLTVGTISSSVATSGFGVNGTGWTQTFSSTELGTSVISSNIATLTQSGTGSYASSIWYNTPVSTLSPLNIEFVYQASGDKAADGVALVFQNQGLNALGGVGGSLGYVGITGNTAAYQINLYNAGGSHIPGSNFVTTNSSGNYNSIPNINFTSGDQIRVQFSYNPAAMTVTVQLTDLVTLQSNQTIYSNINLSSIVGDDAYVGFTGGDGGDTSTQTISSFSMQSVPTGVISLQSGGDILALNSNSIVSGTNISLFANNGSIGTQMMPLTIHTQTQQLETGSNINGTLNASALNSVFVSQPTGDLRIGSIITSSSNGSVSITTGNGNITDGNIPDAFALNTGKLSTAMSEHTIQSIGLREANSANLAIASFEGSVDSSYLQYWTALDNGIAANGNLTLSANGVLYYQPNANLYYANTANQTSNATVAQVNSYADMLYDNAINVFENNMAYGPDWASQPDFQNYNPNYNFTASNSTISALTYQAADISNSFALLSLDALSPQGSQFLGNTTAPAIQTSRLFLKSSGSIGLSLDPVEIQLGSIQNGTLSPREKSLLAMATNAGELQIVGNNVIVKIEKPLFVNVADNGQVQLNAGTSISLTETSGDMNIANISTPGNVRLVAGSSINQVTEVNNATTDNLVQDSDFETPTLGTGYFSYNTQGASWTFIGGSGISGNASGFTQSNPTAPVGNQVAFIQTTGVMSQPLSGLVQGAQYTISFYAAQRTFYPNQSFNITLGNNTIASNVTPNSTSYQLFTYTFTSNSSGTQTLTFTGLNPDQVDQTVFIDQVIITPLVAITANNLRLTSGDAIGSSTTPIAIQITGKLDSYSTSDLYLNQVSGDLLMGTIKSTGTTQINAQGSFYGTDNTIKGSIGNFGVKGTGWTVNSQNQTAGISQDVLTLGNAGSNGESSVWFNQPTVVVNSFIVSFIYQSQYSGNGLTFCIQSDSRGTSAIGDSGAALGYGTNGINPQIQPSIAWQLNNGAAPNATQGVGLNRNGGYGMYQQTDPINFNSNHPIQVVLQYSSIDLEFTQTLTDTVTGEIFSSTVSSGINLFALLGDAKARFGFTGSGPAQTISNFYFSYGAPTISAGNLTLSSGGQIGTSSSPILMLATGSVNATAPNGIYLLQTDGDLYVNSISSQANVSLSAPTGSVVSSSSGSVQSSSLRSPSFGIHATSLPAIGIKANHLQLDSLYSLGSANQPLMTQVKELSAINQFGDIVLNNTGPLAIGDGSPGNAVQAGRSVNITSDSAITINSSVSAAEDIQIRGISGYLGGSRINVNPGVSIASETGGVYLFGGDGVSIASGATVRSHSAVELYSNPIAGVNSTSPSLESRGQIVADNIRFNSSDTGTSLYLALAGIRGVSTSPTVEFNAGSGFDTLTIENRLDKNGLAVSIADGMIQTPNHKLILNAIDSVILELGDGSDHVKIGDNMPMNQLQIFTNGGADTIETTLSKSTVVHQSFDGGTGLDSIKINGSGQNTWASTGLVQSWERTIQHSSTESISLSSATTVNAMPVATSPALQQIPTGLGSNSRYIESTYQQILNRLATPRELSRWSSMLDRNTITRLQLANKLTNSDEARLLRINAWFLNYFGRPATKQESTQSLRRIHSGQSETRVLAGLLANQEFFNRTQSLIATGFSRDRFITGLYKLAIDPSGAPSPALHRFLNQTWQTKGRMAVILNVLQSAPVARNQAEGLSILINQAPAQPQDVQVRLGQSRPSGVQALLLSRRSF